MNRPSAGRPFHILGSGMGWAVAAVCFAALGVGAGGCAESRQTAAALALNKGLTALEQGSYRDARDSCVAAATFDQQNRSALMCWFGAAVELGDWHSASEALAAARLIWPDDEWLRAASVDIAYRQTGQGQEIAPTTEAMAWACAGGACTPAAPGEKKLEGAPLESSALVHMSEGMWPEAAALLEASCNRTACWDMLLLAWVRQNRFDRVSEWLAARPCGSSTATPLAEQLRRFLWPHASACDSPAAKVLLAPEADEANRMVQTASTLPPGSGERLALLESACALEPQWAMAQLLTGSELLLQGDPTQAKAYLERSLELTSEKSWPSVMLSLSELLSYGRFGRSLDVAGGEGEFPPVWRDWLESLVR